jgi:DNA-binding MarR family transcriptional regulator
VYSRSGLTHQAGLLESQGLITRAASADDQRAAVVDITEEGSARVAEALPDHVRVLRELLFDFLDGRDVRTLGDSPLALVFSSIPLRCISQPWRQRHQTRRRTRPR